jgi:hypothetical protein
MEQSTIVEDVIDNCYFLGVINVQAVGKTIMERILLQITYYLESFIHCIGVLNF